ncbi:hypothetical protein BWI75_17640 [Gloeocapsopsis sp. AAB1 = 1H9]|uniref:Uncharacterized protein n=1 Tax=Gloeocapsopsis dulcis AAB1 = 1H9 TaxID=1433147 RepID=A0A6N8FZM8_9CHRO|nr:hypothetical protein [Gloeocapsopsis dulcis AAB1 = 1H9]
MWSFVGSKKNKQWIWLALDTKTMLLRQLPMPTPTELRGDSLHVN